MPEELTPAVQYAFRACGKSQSEAEPTDAHLRVLRWYAYKEGLRIEAEFLDNATDEGPVPEGYQAMAWHLNQSRTCRTIIAGDVGLFPPSTEGVAMIRDLQLEIHVAPFGPVFIYIPPREKPVKNGTAQSMFRFANARNSRIGIAGKP